MVHHLGIGYDAPLMAVCVIQPKGQLRFDRGKDGTVHKTCEELYGATFVNTRRAAGLIEFSQEIEN